MTIVFQKEVSARGIGLVPESRPDRSVAVVGSINTDLVLQLPRLPLPGETVLTESALQIFGGGKGANQAIAAARLGVPVSMIGAVGEDQFGSDRVTQLAGEGIDVANIARIAGRSSGVALITIDDEGQNCIALAAGANQSVAPRHTSCAAVEAASLVMAVVEIPVPPIEAAFATARRQGAITLLNAAPPGRLPREVLALADFLVVNETEAGALIGEPAPDHRQAPQLADRLAGLCGRAAVITLGSGGLCASDGSERIRLPAFATTVVDTTAAGDAFCGALAVGLLERMGFAQALRFASAAGAAACRQLGASSSLPDRSTVNQILAA